jgi:3-hydroxyisobutyrate dehydrogenase-like beta-hydroxyacid dehydrogenase
MAVTMPDIEPTGLGTMGAALPFRFIGIGVSVGDGRTRNGPAIMAGGSVEDWSCLAPVLQTIAARAEDGTPFANHMGPAGAGHFVKSVHNSPRNRCHVCALERRGLPVLSGRDSA